MSEQTQPWLESRLPVFSALRLRLLDKPTPRDQPYLAGLLVLVAGSLIFLILTGVVLAVYYDPAHGFDSVQFIRRNVNNGWLVQSFHATGTTMLFATMYLVLFREIIGAGYRAPGEVVWFLKLCLLLLLLLVGYLGYILADGAASYWSLQTTTMAGAHLSGIPGGLAAWFFGGAAGDGTLARMAVLHAALALLIVAVLALHFAAKRAITPVPSPAPRGAIAWHPYYTSQYFVAFVVFALVFAVLVFFAPHLGENPLNAVAASPLVVPVLMAPPWYLLPVSALSLALPGAGGGIIAVLAAFAVLFALPWLDRSRPGTPPSAIYKFLVVILALDIFALCIGAAAPSSALGTILSILFIGWYFLHFLVLTPLVTAMESK